MGLDDWVGQRASLDMVIRTNIPLQGTALLVHEQLEVH